MSSFSMLLDRISQVYFTGESHRLQLGRFFLHIYNKMAFNCNSTSKTGQQS